ncbi:cell division protein FtsA [Melghiribacillus thermohalophilus]|uniref:Cell division protein FtsA n=1 Tax=Melghiribacillus thermohalophilus TaxID=1324956 RepID=A0A4R3ND66_9BACI|nr:cell division protein FtsA [Melghiribacillus thermohalophilus]TCT26866.1 cell division protein FtsA [Melghiribacillus thermohalophilus]
MNNNEILVSLDIGTSRIKVIIGEVTHDSLNIIGVGTAKSNGMKKGAIVDIDQTVHAIRSAVEQAERMVDMQIERVIVGVKGNHIQLQPCHGVVAVSSENREIGNEDITRVIDAAQVLSIPPEREIIDVFPKQFIVDGLDEISDPRGMIGVRLEMEGTIITCSKTVLHNTLKCVERAGLEVQDICLQPLAGGSVALSRDEKNLGVALIDIGGGSTTISVFESGHLKDTTVIPLGGDNITKDLSIGLKTSTEQAEEIKVNHGHAYYNDAQEDETFDVPIIGSNQRQTFNQLQISDMIEARLEEIYSFVDQEIKRMGYQELPGGYVLTGGVMSMPGVLELAQDIFRHNVRIAIPDYIGVREPQFTAGVGILQFAYHNAKVQGKELVTAVRMENIDLKPKKKKVSSSKEGKKNKESGIAKLFSYFFD